MTEVLVLELYRCWWWSKYLKGIFGVKVYVSVGLGFFIYSCDGVGRSAGDEVVSYIGD